MSDQTRAPIDRLIANASRGAMLRLTQWADLGNAETRSHRLPQRGAPRGATTPRNRSPLPLCRRGVGGEGRSWERAAGPRNTPADSRLTRPF
jgi:hypothetical protein